MIKKLVFVSSGNLSHDDRLAYPLSNEDCSIEDPAQSFNAITVGAFTLKIILILISIPALKYWLVLVRCHHVTQLLLDGITNGVANPI